MKLDQEQIKKIFLAVLLLIALLYGYFNYLLGPLQLSEKRATDGIAAALPQISADKKELNNATALEQQAPQATAFLDSIKNSIPDGAPIAWFPPKITDFFKGRGIDKCTTHLISEAADPLPGFKRMVWSVDIPRVEFVPLGQAVAELENSEPLLTVLNVSIDAAREDAQYQHATLTLTTLVKS
jgi:hypothetical protein